MRPRLIVRSRPARRRTTRARAFALACAALAFAAALPASASAAPAPPGLPEQARLLASFEMTQESSWRTPLHITYTDCFHEYWAEGEGGQRWQIRTRRPVRVLAYRLSDDSPVVFKYGSWELTDVGGDGLDAGGMIVRRGRVSTGWFAGRCGGRPENAPPKQTDCGSRIPSYDVTFGFTRSRASFTASQKDEQPNPFVSCPLVAPSGFGGSAPAPAAAAYSPAALLADLRPVTIIGFRRVTETIRGDRGSRTRTTGTIRWTLTLRPAGR